MYQVDHPDQSTVNFECLLAGDDEDSPRRFKMACGPDDNGAPRLTLMLPGED